MENNENIGRVKIPPKLYNQMEQKMLEVLIECGIKSAPIDPFAIASKKGFLTIPYSQLSSNTRKELIEQGLIAGASRYDPQKETFVIYYNDNEMVERQRFTIAHELAHIFLGHKTESDLAHKCANESAGYLLAPAPMIHLYRITSEMMLAQKFNLSESCALNRFTKYKNWLQHGGPLKNYEEKFLRYLNLK